MPRIPILRPHSCTARLTRRVAFRNPAKASVFRELPCQGLKRSGGLPDPRLGGIQVREYAENPAAAGGAAGKSVHVKQIVTLVKGQVAAIFFEGTKTREIENPLIRVRRKKLRQELDHSRAVIPESGMDPLGGRGISGNSAENVVRRGGRKHFCACAARPIVAKARNSPSSLRECERGLAEKKYLAAFESRAIIARARGRRARAASSPRATCNLQLPPNGIPTFVT